MKTIIHINQHIIKANRKKNERKPVITVKTYKSNRYAHEVDILDKEGNVVATIKYSPDKPLSCGAHVWLSTENKVVIRNLNEEGVVCRQQKITQDPNIENCTT